MEGQGAALRGWSERIEGERGAGLDRYRVEKLGGPEDMSRRRELQDEEAAGACEARVRGTHHLEAAMRPRSRQSMIAWRSSVGSAESLMVDVVRERAWRSSCLHLPLTFQLRILFSHLRVLGQETSMRRVGEAPLGFASRCRSSSPAVEAQDALSRRPLSTPGLSVRNESKCT